jgi:acetate---CoA ligase (ADP-forming)
MTPFPTQATINCYVRYAARPAVSKGVTMESDRHVAEGQGATSANVTDLAETDQVRLRDGAIVYLRRAVAADETELRSFLCGLRPEARHLRFFTAACDLDSAAHWASTTGGDRCGLLAHDEAGRLVGHAAFIALDSDRAEVAIEVADHLHDEGLGTILIERLAAVAEARGMSTFVAEVLPENRRMLEVFRDGFDARVRMLDGTDAVELRTSSWRLARERFATASEIV